MHINTFAFKHRQHLKPSVELLKLLVTVGCRKVKCVFLCTGADSAAIKAKERKKLPENGAAGA